MSTVTETLQKTYTSGQEGIETNLKKVTSIETDAKDAGLKHFDAKDYDLVSGEVSKSQKALNNLASIDTDKLSDNEKTELDNYKEQLQTLNAKSGNIMQKYFSGATTGPNAPTSSGVKIEYKGKQLSVGEYKNQKAEEKKTGLSGTSGGGDISISNVDFFKLYGLKYFADEDSFGGFIPIQLTSYKYDKNAGSGVGWTTSDNAANDMNADGNDRIKIILPFKPSSITDSGSVSIKRKYDGTIAQAVIGGINKIATSANNFLTKGKGEDTQNFLYSYLAMDYDYASLKKEINIPFILPLVSRTCIPNLQWCDNVRKALGILQGQLYPHTLYGILPNAFNLKLGNLYRGFKGFITKVDITFSEEQYTSKDGKVVWPLVIEGSIGFKNLNSYMWSKNSDTSTKLGEMANDARFNLSNQPGILFGDWSNTPSSSEQSSGIGVSKEILNPEKGSEEEKLYEGVEQDKGEYDKLPTPKSAQEQKKEVEDAKTKATEAGGDNGEKTAEGAKKNTEKIDSDDDDINGKGDIKGENTVKESAQSTATAAKSIASSSKGTSPSSSLSSFFSKINTTINTVKNVYNTVQNVKNGNYTGALSSLSSAFTSISPTTATTLKSLANIATAGQNVVNSVKNGVTIDNVGSLFTNIESLTKAIETTNTGLQFVKVTNGVNSTTTDIVTKGSEAIETLNKNTGNLVDSTVGKASSVLGVGLQQLVSGIFGLKLTTKQTEDEDEEEEE